MEALPSTKDLYNQMKKSFNKDELRDLCFELNTDYEDILGESRSSKIRELIEYCRRRNRLQNLLEKCRILRPDSYWPDLYDLTSKSEDISDIKSLNEKSKINDLLMIAEGIRNLVNVIVAENTRLLFPFIADPNQRRDVGFKLMELYYTQISSHRFKEWIENLRKYYDIGIQEPSDPIAQNMVRIIAELYLTLYSDDNQDRLSGKRLLSIAYEDTKLSDADLRKATDDYLNSLRNMLDELGTCIGRIKALA